jgi:riboflavin-specific deaminase-like protein
VRRLFPDPAETSVSEQLAALDLAAMAGDERPFVISNFALTLDGRATIAGRSGPIGSEADTAMLVGLRTRADAVMIGAGTMRAERYGRIAPDEAQRERRTRDGLRAEPLMVLVSGRLDLPWDAPLFRAGGGECVICTASEAEPPDTEADISLLRQPDGVDFSALLANLRREHGVRALLTEGGPRLHAQMIEQGLIDELFVTHAPKLAGGEGPTLATGLQEAERRLELSWLLHEESTGELFGRYRLV